MRARRFIQRKVQRGVARWTNNVLLPLIFTAIAASAADSAARIEEDRAAGRPLVAHVIVALADNEHQGIVPVPGHLGDGQEPMTNLYWGARYGVRTFLPRDAGWKKVPFASAHPKHVLERLVFMKEIAPETIAFIIADAWDGQAIGRAIESFTNKTAGHEVEIVRVMVGERTVELSAGGDAHVIAYLGHNGLMDVSVEDPSRPSKEAKPRSAIVLACLSRSYFVPVLMKTGAHPLLLTKSLMAPEAYTLDAALTAWFRGRGAREVKTEAASAYCRYQRCSLSAGEKMFATE